MSKTFLPDPSPAKIFFQRLFQKDWKKLQYDKQRQKFCSEVLPNFLRNPFSSDLRNHEIGRAYPGCRSIDVTGDVRAIYFQRGVDFVFLRIGTHNQLYG